MSSRPVKEVSETGLNVSHLPDLIDANSKNRKKLVPINQSELNITKQAAHYTSSWTKTFTNHPEQKSQTQAVARGA